VLLLHSRSPPGADHLRQYGDVFTFILFGRRVTVALGAKGNNFVLGGRSTNLSAEDAYTVSIQQVQEISHSQLKYISISALDYPSLR
jgi:hypothetical protein